jgi:hypothetical protein
MYKQANTILPANLATVVKNTLYHNTHIENPDIYTEQVKKTAISLKKCNINSYTISF